MYSVVLLKLLTCSYLNIEYYINIRRLVWVVYIMRMEGENSPP